MEKLGKVLFNVVLYSFLFITATLVACLIWIAGIELANFINK
jgi:hypothetical protein